MRSTPGTFPQSPDVLVIGSGPAGALSALRLARKGIATLLVDGAAFPRAKLCGGCLARSGQNVLQSNGLENLPALRTAPTVDSLRLISGGRAASFPIPSYRVIDRARFDAELVEAAMAAGARFLDRCRAIVGTGGLVTLSEAGGGRALDVRARLIVVADGLKGSSLRDVPGFGWRIRDGSHVGIGMIGTCMPAGCSRDSITMFHAAHGYLGIAPLADGRADLAAAIRPDWVKARGGGRALPAVLASFGLDPESVETDSPTLGAPHLTRTRERVEDGSSIFLCGDAAGYLEPFTGEGMSWALAGAEGLVPHLLEALGGTYRPGRWTATLREEWRRRRGLCRVVSGLLRRPLLTAGFVRASAHMPALADGVGTLVGAAQRVSARRAIGGAS